MPGKIWALAGAAPASAAIAAPPAKNIVTAFMALTPHLFPTRRMERAAADFAPSHHAAAPAVNGAVGSGSAVVLRDPVPAPQPPLTVPLFHRTAVAPPFGDGNRGTVVLGLEFAEMVDVAAEAIEIIKPVVQHAPPRPPLGRRCAVYHRSVTAPNRRCPGRPGSARRMVKKAFTFPLRFPG